MLKTTTFYFCNNCKIYAKESELFSECPECKASNSAIEVRDCYRPSIVVVEEKGKPSEEGRELAYTECEKYLLQPIGADITIPKEQIKQTPICALRLLGKREILTIVSGIKDYESSSLSKKKKKEIPLPGGIKDDESSSPKKFTLCGKCGYYLGGDFTSVRNNQQNKHRDILGKGWHEPSRILSDINLYHTFDTTTLLLTFRTNDRIFLVTLKNALINAAQRIVGADDGEIEGIIKDNNLILYDNIEGGAGYVNTIFDKFEEILDEIKNVILSCNCERGCIKCLYSYRRRRDIQEIDKRVLLEPLKTLQRVDTEQNISQKSETIFDEKDLHARISNFGILEIPKVEYISRGFKISGGAKCILSAPGRLDGAREVRNYILSAKKSVSIVSLYVSDMPVVWENNKSFSWCDMLIACKMNGVDSVKIVVRSPRNDWEKYALGRLYKRGVEVYVFEEGEGDEGIAHHKIVMIDEDDEESIAVLQSANLSPEVIKNADFYIFLTKTKNREAHSTLSGWLQNLIKRCRKWSG